LLMVFVIGGVGLHLRRARTAESSVFVIRLIIFVLFLTPLLDIQVALKAIHEFEPIAWFPSIRSVLAALSLFFIALPYVLGGRIVTYQSRGVSRSSETPHTALYIIGLACALLPSTIAAFSVFVGLPADNIYYFVALSYLAAAAWSAWWYYRHSRPREKSFTAG